jgi:two-component system nitrogen regulation response regulator NtrX
MAKILIIDDERSIRSTLREILEYEDYAVEDIDNGVDGLELSVRMTMTWYCAISK